VRAAVFVEVDGDLAVENVELDDPGPGEVLVRMTASGVCHSDLSVLDGTLGIRPPAVLGHEGAGTVQAVGPGVTKVQPGDHVIASFRPACGGCWHCRRGEGQHCELYGRLGERHPFRRPDGSRVGGAIGGTGTFAERAVVSQHSVVPITSNLPPEQLALVGCAVTTGVGAVLNTAKVEAGATVSVVGCGGVGQSVIQGARIAGASTIIAIDTAAAKLAAAKRLGATEAVLVGADGDPVKEVRELTDGRGVDYAFEAIGRAASLEQAYRMLRRRGVLVAVGLSGRDERMGVRPYDLVLTEKQVRGCLYGSAQVARDFPRIIRFAETGQLDLASMVSRVIGLDQVNDAFAAIRAGDVIRSVISYG
jgi:S-(hydroxymethyl)glutathione dehydrogenase / alcohol dehydrogenase